MRGNREKSVGDYGVKTCQIQQELENNCKTLKFHTEYWFSFSSSSYENASGWNSNFKFLLNSSIYRRTFLFKIKIEWMVVVDVFVVESFWGDLWLVSCLISWVKLINHRGQWNCLHNMKMLVSLCLHTKHAVLYKLSE